MPIVGKFRNNGDLEIIGELLEDSSTVQLFTPQGNICVDEIMEATDSLDIGVLYEIKDKKLYIKGEILEGSVF